MMPVAPGHPDYSSTGPNEFVPQLWSGKMQVKYYAYCVLTHITNNDWEGEIKKMGDTVFIRSIPSIAVNDYYIGKKLNYENPQSPALTLTIDKGKDWGIKLNDVYRIQSDLPLLDKWTTDASLQMKIKVETSFFADPVVYAGMDAANMGATAGAKSQSYNMGAAGAPIQLTKANVLDYIVDMNCVLDEQNVLDDQRWIVLPTWAVGMIKKSDLKDASLMGDGQSTLRNGRIGMIDNTTIYKSNLLNVVADGSGVPATYALFGHKNGLTFASQVTETEKLRDPFDFGDIVRGLKIYGYKAAKPQAFGCLYIRK